MKMCIDSEIKTKPTIKTQKSKQKPTIHCENEFLVQAFRAWPTAISMLIFQKNHRADRKTIALQYK